VIQGNGLGGWREASNRQRDDSSYCDKITAPIDHGIGHTGRDS
jgi:hypothetical protein